jgi:mannose-6-phosphate isomerase-like protein (cupin superfamily)
MSEDTIFIGRKLNEQGKPVEGTGVALDKDSPTAKLLLAQNTVIIANPVTKEYGAAVKVKNEHGQIITKGLGIIPPNSVGPPEHIHPTYDETFTVVEGKFEFLLNKKSIIMSEGETVVVKRGTAHTFKPADKKVCSFLLEANPQGKLNEVIRTIWGLALDGKTNSKGQPNEFWQGIAIGNELKDDTLFVSPPPFVQRFMFKLFGQTALKKGFKGIYDKYSEDNFWTSRIEQLTQKPA